MAVTFDQVAMPSEQQKGLHPFFERSTNQIIPRHPQTSQDEKLPVLAQSILTGTLESEHYAKAPTSVLEASKPSEPIEQTTSGFTQIEVSHGADIAASFESGHDQVVSQSSSTKELPTREPARGGATFSSQMSTNGENDIPRKRRKLSHSDSEAYSREPSIGASPIPNIIPANHAIDSTKVTAEDDTKEAVSTSDVQKAPAPILDATGTDVNSFEIEGPTTSSPPKKLLRLNGAGGFKSPPSKTSKDFKEEPKAGAAVKPKIGRRKARSLIVILKYGRHDEEQKIVGEKIDRIQNAIKPQAVGTESNPISIPASSAAKSTHPFFLGKSARMVSGTAPSKDPEKDSESVDKPKPSDSHKVFSSSGKIWMPTTRSSQTESSQSNSQGIFARTSMLRFPGTHDAPWPGADFTRIEGADAAINMPRLTGSSRPPLVPIKRKTKAPVVEAQENVMSNFETNLFNSWNVLKLHSSGNRFQPPLRIVKSGKDIQDMVLERLALPSGQDPNLVHPVLETLFKKISSSLSAFDKGECESLAWTQKYAPPRTGEILQSQREMAVLKAWLQAQSVNSTNIIGTSGTKKPEDKHQRQKRKKRKRQDEMDDFIVSSDEDENLGSLRDLSDEEPTFSAASENIVRSLVREGIDVPGPTRANAILISGPHGCGKTAAALAAAKELDFDVFEIGPGSQRSGRDILDRIGDMTSNHQVSRARNSEEPLSSPAEDMIPTTRAADQSSLGSFFTAKVPKPKKVSSLKKTKPLPDSQPKVKQPSRQKQAVILLEEVDVLFEQDRQFWETVVELAVRSKRPIIMTCTDEKLVPQDELSLYAILRFKSPQEGLAAKYLLLLAAVEGHILDFEATRNLFKARRRDLRASISELQFWCQMAIGDRKGGIEWFLPRWPPGVDLDEHHRKLRTASDSTLPLEIILPEHAAEFNEPSLTTEESFIRDSWAEWAVHPTELATDRFDENVFTGDQLTSPQERLLHLQERERDLDLLSATDIFSRVDLPSNSQIHEKLDATQPPITASHRSDYTTGYRLLEAEMLRDYHAFDTQVTTFTGLGIYKRAACESNSTTESRTATPDKQSTTSLYSRVATRILNGQSASQPAVQLLKTANSKRMSTAFQPLLTSTLHPLITSFEQGEHIIGMDIAPFVRSIASFDLALERQRDMASSSQGSGSGKAKQARTTRASRSALEGSQRSVTRRERWFAKDLDLDLVLSTAGHGWPQA